MLLVFTHYHATRKIHLFSRRKVHNSLKSGRHNHAPCLHAWAHLVKLYSISSEYVQCWGKEYRRQNISFLLDLFPSAVFLFGSWDSIGGVVVRLWATQLRNLVSIPGKSKRFFSSPLTSISVVLPTQPFMWLVLTEAYFPGTSWPGREDKHSHPSGAEVKNEWSYASTFSYAFMACTGTSIYLYLFLFYLFFPYFWLYFFHYLFLYFFSLFSTIFFFLSLPFSSSYYSFPYFFLFLFDVNVVINNSVGWIDEWGKYRKSIGKFLHDPYWNP